MLRTKFMLVVSALLLAPSLHAAEANCIQGWEYRIADLISADNTRSAHATRSGASNGLVGTLNRLGGQGWELVTDHRVELVEEITDAEMSRTNRETSEWVAQLKPAVALFKRAVEVCN